MIRRPLPFAALAVVTALAFLVSCSETPTEQAAAPPALDIMEPVTFVGAGDIAHCWLTGDEATARMLDRIPGTVYTLGDNAYNDGSTTDYNRCYEPTWGRHKARTRPSPGNHEYYTAGGAGYYAYFGASAGEPGKGYYSYDLGDWHIISLNSNVDMTPGSAQEVWLRADLAASTKRCTLAYFHHPLFSSSEYQNGRMRPAWQALYEANAEVILAGHHHAYERFAPMRPDGTRDDVTGIRSFVAGLGGAFVNPFRTTVPNSLVRYNLTYGLLKFTLGTDTYTWEFIPTTGLFRDTGTGTCR